MSPYFKILRPDEALMMAMPVVIISIVGHDFSISVFLATLIVFLMAGAGNVINDVFDHKIDAVNKPDRPIPSGRISLKNARIYAGILYTVSICLSLIISYLINNFLFSVIIICSAVIIYAYSRYFKAMPLVGNIVVGGMIGFCFVVGGFILLCNTNDWHIFKVSVYIGLLAAVANVARELVKDMEDVHGDKLCGARTFPILYGKKASSIITILLLAVTVAVHIYLYTFGIFNIAYIIIAIIAVVLYVYSAYALFASKFEPVEATCTKVIKILKIAMAFSLLAITIGSFDFLR
jgi:geranylgeranylglycerol-phosphate geranylgeranyltransferase